MKKLLFTVAVLFATSGVMAQVIKEKGNFNEALAKAKAEKKMLMLVGSATWCGPCQMVDKQIFTTVEAGNYINSKFIVKKYELDKEDPDSVSKKYNVTAFPTFVFIDGNGKEVARMLGAAADTREFLKRIEETTNPENSLAARYERFKKDPSYGITYLTFLTEECYKYKEADDALGELFARRNVADNFNKESMDYYDKNLYNIQSPVFDYMVKNPKEVIAILGEERYNQFLTVKANEYISKKAYSMRPNAEVLRKTIADVMGVKQLVTPYVTFMNDVKDDYVNQNLDAVFAKADKYLKATNTRNRLDIATTVRMICGRDVDEKKASLLIPFYEKCAEYEQDEKQKNMYKVLRADIESIIIMNRKKGVK